MDPYVLRFDDPELECSYSAANFRAAYALHLSYTLSLLLMFVAGSFDGTFCIASYTLGPGFLAMLLIRVRLHQMEDERWAQSVGTWLMCFVDSLIWAASACVFRGFQGYFDASVLIYGMYCIAMVNVVWC